MEEWAEKIKNIRNEKKLKVTAVQLTAEVYIKCEIHIFAPPPFLIHTFFPKGNLSEWGGGRHRWKNVKTFFL